MDKSLLQPLSGFRDNLGPTKSWVIERIRQIFQLYGYQALETPALERQEVLLGKLGDTAQKQLYLFEDNGQRKVGLRFDLTVPLARFVAANFRELPLPFKRYEIGPVWRAERPQQGRYRQFTQADIDIVGTESITAEVELLEIVRRVGEALNLPFVIKINNRQLVDDLLSELKVLPSERSKILIELDKKDKVSNQEIARNIKSLNVADVQANSLTHLFLDSGQNALEQIREKVPNSAGLKTIEELITASRNRDVEVDFEPSLVRGLDYYTGTIFEAMTEGASGSVAGGGRYDSLVESLIGLKIPAVGVSFGVDRLADLLAAQTENETVFLVNLPETNPEVEEFVAQLRTGGRQVELYLDSQVELGKQIKYADKRGYRKIYLPLEDEWAKGQIVEKNLATGNQKTIPRQELLKSSSAQKAS